MRRTVLAIFVVLFLSPFASAQNYKFSVPEAEVTVTIFEDGSAEIYYLITFTCADGAHPIDVVDIGMPNMSNHWPNWAAIDGGDIPSDKIRISTYLKPKGCGYEVQLGNQEIKPGETAVFEFSGSESDMVWQDTTDPLQASFRFTPTWFEPGLVMGKTKLILRYILPITKENYVVEKEQIFWQTKGQDFDAKGVMEGEDYISVAWVREVRFTQANMFGVSFPKKYVTSVKKDSILRLMGRWLEGNQAVKTGSGIALLVGFAVAFFVVTRGTGITLFLILAVAMVIAMAMNSEFQIILFPVVPIIVLLSFLSRKKRKKHYFPAELCREGEGIKRGLTAVQAAVLLEVPLHKVLTMVIFGLAKKGIVEIFDHEPLKVRVIGAAHGDKLWLLPDGSKLKLRLYERRFVSVFQNEGRKPVEEMDLSNAFDVLIKEAVGEVVGFDLEKTREYYRRIVSRAWRQVEREAGFEAKEQKLDKDIEWLMMDHDWGHRFGQGGHGHHYHPTWWYRSSNAVGTGIPLPGQGVARSVPTTPFSDVANSLVGRFEGSCNKMVGSIDALSTTVGGGVDLSAIDTFTGEFLSSLAEGGGGSSGGGGCACAGCACACACAGGGR